MFLNVVLAEKDFFYYYTKHVLVTKPKVCTIHQARPPKIKFSIKKKHLKEQNHFMQHLSIHILVMGDPPFFLAVLSQPLGPGGHTSFCTSALLLFQVW